MYNVTTFYVQRCDQNLGEVKQKAFMMFYKVKVSHVVCLRFMIWLVLTSKYMLSFVYKVSFSVMLFM